MSSGWHKTPREFFKREYKYEVSMKDAIRCCLVLILAISFPLFLDHLGCIVKPKSKTQSIQRLGRIVKQRVKWKT